MKFSVLTLGCKVNQAESAFIENAFRNAGHSLVDISERPDICIINTCTVTSKSDYQSRQLIRKAHRAGSRIIVTGCYSELNKMKTESMEGVQSIISNSDKLNIIKKLIGTTTDNALYLNICYQKRSRFFIKIQDGCNYSCSYCAIPRARGRSISIEPAVVISQINDAVSNGFNEVVLTGIHLGCYGIDLKHKVKLSDLIKTILKKTTIRRIRLSSLEVKEVDNELLDLFIDKRICNHLHIPLQSGDDKVLRLMNRGYSSRFYYSTINKILKQIHGVAIGTDVIVGFPGEGEAEFRNTYSLLESLPLSYMHIFTFSPRPGTAAAEMPDNTSSATKKERVHLLEALNIRKKTEYMNSQINETLDVIIEEDGGDGTYCGRASNYLKIYMPATDCIRGSLIYVRVEGLKDGKLVGTPFFHGN
ncbi:MAG: tRNA (N(6)-L-threonylcarbamoyladenosine(37)-C(2))-methylthiotransferase MtaB [Nitrospirae bacterium]|nr:tRNA (N(6)-L-threonylcarbamoyladenosine(37)-C(2))-methylthiotransferase MtaB [Nitrospirota bacterium]